MTEQNYQHPQMPAYEEESEIDIMELLTKMWKKRRMIIIWCVCGALLGLLVGYSIPNTYTASVTLVPESEGRSSGGSLSSLAAMAGINLSDNSVDAIHVGMFPEVVASTPFIVDLFDMPVSFMHKDTLVQTNLLDYLKEYQKSPWWTTVIKASFKALEWCMSLFQAKEEESLPIAISDLNPYNLPKEDRAIVRLMSETIEVIVDKKTGKTIISAEMQNPQIVADVVSKVVENLKIYMSDYRTSKARQDVENLSAICEQRKNDYYQAQQSYANFVDANKNVVLQSAQAERERLQQEMNLSFQVYSQVATQLEAARIAEQKAKPVFTVVKPVEIPYKKTAPSKAKMLVVFTFLAGCLAAAWVLYGEDYWKKLRDNLSQEN